FAMTFAACEHIHLAVPGLQDTDGQRSGTPEAVKSHALSPLDSGDAQAAETDDACAKERCEMRSVQPIGQRHDKVAANGSVFRIAAVHRITSKHRMIAEVLHRVAAKPAIAVHAAHPGDAYTGPYR